MTDTEKIIIIAVAILMIPLLMISGTYTSDIASHNQRELIASYAKRDDIITQQQKLESLLQDLNNTLAYEVARQQDLSQKLLTLSADKAAKEALAAVQNQVVINAPQPPQVVPVPVVAPIKTRAS